MRLDVIDSGIGIAAEDQVRLFDSFQQVDGTSSRIYGGTGLGLSIVKQLATMMGGDVGVVSTPGEGSLFWVEFSLENASDNGDAIGTHPSIHKGLRALIVDDNKTCREILNSYLNHYQINCTCVEDAVSALAALSAASRADQIYDIVITDLVMPNLNGLDFARRIREDELNADIPIILLSSANLIPEYSSVSAGTINAHLTKPVHRSLLYQEVYRAIGLPPLTSPGEIDDDAPYPRTTATLEAHILLAEDNEINQLVAVEQLRGFGCTVDVATNGQETVDAYKRGSYDLIFMDCQMPVMDGFQAVQLIRADERSTGRHTPVVALTAHALAEDLEKCIKAGMDDYLSKPFKADHLYNVLTKWLPKNASGIAERDTDEAGDNSLQTILTPKVGGMLRDAGLDPAVVEPLRVGKPDLWKKLIGVYMAATPANLENLEQALANNDCPSIQMTAHMLKSSSANMGAVKLADLCRQLEAAADEGNLVAGPILLAEICHEFNIVSAALTSDNEDDATTGRFTA